MLSFDWATANLTGPNVESPELVDAVRSLKFRPECFSTMRSGETWEQPSGGGAHMDGFDMGPPSARVETF